MWIKQSHFNSLTKYIFNWRAPARVEIYTNHIILSTNWRFITGWTDLNRPLYRRTHYYRRHYYYYRHHHHHRHTYKKQNHWFNIQLNSSQISLKARQTSLWSDTHNAHKRTKMNTRQTHNANRQPRTTPPRSLCERTWSRVLWAGWLKSKRPDRSMFDP